MKAFVVWSLLVLWLGVSGVMAAPAEVWVDDDFNAGTPGWGVTSFADLSDGVGAVATSGTVYVAAGAYDESGGGGGDLFLGKPLRMLGAQANVSVSGRTAGAATESTIRGRVVLAKSYIEVNGFTVKNHGQAWGVFVQNQFPPQPSTDILIAYNIVDDIGAPGGGATAVYTGEGPDRVTIRNNRISNVTAGAGNANGINIGWSRSTDSSEWVTIKDNVIQALSASASAVAINLNLGWRTAGVGVLNAVVQGNTVSGLVSGNGDAEGLALATHTPNAVVRGNTFNMAGSGICILFSTTNPNGGTVTVDGNRFDAAYGIYAQDTRYTVRAESNWWGHASGPLDASDDRGTGGLYNPNGRGCRVTNYVDYEPWYTGVSLANLVPYHLALAPRDVTENKPVGTRVGTFSCTDPDGVSPAYSLVAGNGTNDVDNGSFAVVADELRTGGVFDYETKSTYRIFAQVDDGSGGTNCAPFVVTVNDVSGASWFMAR